MKNLLRVLQAWALLLMAAACGPAGPVFDPVAHQAEVLQWRDDRIASLKAPGGYLNQVGLFWVDEGRWSIGAPPFT